MRKSIPLAIVMTMLLAVSAIGDNAKSPTPDQIDQLVGGPLFKMGRLMGVPDDVYVNRGSAVDGSGDTVMFVFGSAKIQANNSTVSGVGYHKGWTQPVEGVSLSENMTDVVKALGSDYKTVDSSGYDEWKLPKLGAVLDVYWTTDKSKVDSILVWAQ